MGKWRNYLVELQKRGVNWQNPDLLCNRFGISERAARQVIDARLDEIDNEAELVEAQRELEGLNNGTDL